MTPFETALMNEMRTIRKTFADRNLSHMHVNIEIDGPTLHDELKITFQVGDYGYSYDVKGSNLDACITEYFRRKNWKEAHDYLALPNVERPE